MLPAGRYSFDDVKTGDRISIGEMVVTEGMIDRFAELTGDRFEIHMSHEAAQNHGFKGRVAHGLLVLSLVDGLKNQAEAQFTALASLGWDWKFVSPVIAGDLIQATLEVAAKKETSNPLKGILTLQFIVRNQNGVTVQKGINTLMVYR